MAPRTREALERLRAAFLERPGMHLSVTDASHLCGLDPYRSEVILDVLVRVGFLVRTDDGRFSRNL
jgi:hypothetical protein